MCKTAMPDKQIKCPRSPVKTMYMLLGCVVSNGRRSWEGRLEMPSLNSWTSATMVGSGFQSQMVRG